MPQLLTAPNGEVQTLFAYVLNGIGTLGVKMWVDTTTIRGVIGWMAWGYGRDSQGAYLNLEPIVMPENATYNFVVVYGGDRTAATSAIHWELVGESVTGSTIGVPAAPRELPATGWRLHLPMVLR